MCYQELVILKLTTSTWTISKLNVLLKRRHDCNLIPLLTDSNTRTRLLFGVSKSVMMVIGNCVACILYSSANVSFDSVEVGIWAEDKMLGLSLFTLVILGLVSVDKTAASRSDWVKNCQYSASVQHICDLVIWADIDCRPGNWRACRKFQITGSQRPCEKFTNCSRPLIVQKRGKKPAATSITTPSPPPSSLLTTTTRPASKTTSTERGNVSLESDGKYMGFAL